ncbi:MAG TPA: SIR2 family protein [Gemmatimonadales bacterium]
MSVGPAADLAPPAPAPVPNLVAQVAECVRSGECTLFLGAGVHALPPPGCAYAYAEAEAPPRGADLARRLAAAFDPADAAIFPDTGDLRRVALYYEHVAFDRARLVQALLGAVQENKRPSPMLRALAELPFTHVITTNYDSLLERALAAANKDVEVSVYSATRAVSKPPSRKVGAQRPFLLKIHGDFEHEGPQPDAQSIVITEEDYINFVLRMRDADELNPVPLPVRARLAQYPTLFVGYSLSDYNLRILFRALRYTGDWLGQPFSFSVDPSPSPVIRKLMTDEYQIVYVTEDLWSFVPALYRAVLNKELAP